MSRIEKTIENGITNYACEGRLWVDSVEFFLSERVRRQVKKIMESDLYKEIKVTGG